MNQKASRLRAEPCSGLLQGRRIRAAQTLFEGSLPSCCWSRSLCPAMVTSLFRLGSLALVLELLTPVLGKGGCGDCDLERNEFCYKAERDIPCFSPGSVNKCLDSGGTYCAEDQESCEDCMAKGQDCFNKNWAVPCYYVGLQAKCEKSGSLFCGKAQGTVSCDDCLAANKDCFNKDWAEPCYYVGLKDTCEESGSQFCAKEVSSLPMRAADPVLQWLLLAATMFLVLLSVLILWLRRCRSKPTPWDVEAPLDRLTLRQADALKGRVESIGKQLEGLSGQKLGFLAGLRRTFLESRAARCKQQRQRLLAKTALAAASGPPNWSISVQQLVRFHDQHKDDLKDYCACHGLGPRGEHICLQKPCPQAQHHQCATFWYDASFTGSKLVPNMHVLVKCVIMPLTRVDHEGILGMWAKLSPGAPQKATTFISHCWNEQLGHFVDTLQHRPGDERIWICSFALPQNMDIGSVLGNKPSTSPFAEALKSVDFVDVAVDAKIEPPTRSWCCFELYLASTHGKSLTVICPRQGTPGENAEMYTRITQAMQEVDIRKCSATNPEDHKMIMKEIRGNEVKVNKMLRACAERQAKFASHITSSLSENTGESSV